MNILKINFHEKLELCDKSLTRTPGGYLQVQGIIARTGTQHYSASELGQAGGNRVIAVERPSEEVSEPLSVASFMHKPITDNHPINGSVDSKNFTKLAKGFITDVSVTDSGSLKADIMITDEKLINSVESGKRGLSAGYGSEVEFSDDGSSAIIRKIRGNHVAFVSNPRCGKECRIFDSAMVEFENDKEDLKMAKIKINDVEIEIQDSAVPMVQQVVAEVGTLKASVKKITDDRDVMQGKLDASETKVKELTDAKVSDADINKAAEELTDLRLKANIVDSKFDCKGKTIPEVKKSIVIAKIGDSMKEKTDAYISARFDVLVEDAEKRKKDPLTHSLRDAEHEEPDEDMVKKARQAKMDRSNKKAEG